VLIELEKQLENMGKIKKILENELVGGTQSTDVYPVTSTKAIYDENNVRLDTILKPATKEAAGLMSPEDKNNIGSLQTEVTKKFDKANVAQETGSATDKVMSQKAVSDILNEFRTVISNAAIHVDGGMGVLDLSVEVDSTTVLDNPVVMGFFTNRGKFLAMKNSVWYSHWNANVSKNIAPSSRYGIETDDGVFPFNNQIYKIKNQIYIANCSNGTCTMKKL
jgi:hypothetical protein